MRRSLVIAAIAAAESTNAGAQSRGELRVWTARALATVLAEVGSEFERATGHRL